MRALQLGADAGLTRGSEAIATDLWIRIWSKVQVEEGADACWLWTGTTSKKRNGYRVPQIRLGDRKTKSASVPRLILKRYQGEPEPGHEAGHTCPKGENMLCVRPEHLRWMTRREQEQWKRAHPKSTPAVQES